MVFSQVKGDVWEVVVTGTSLMSATSQATRPQSIATLMGSASATASP